MSLQVWLPLNGDLTNQGLTPVTVTNNGATVDNNGKIGKCYSFDGSDDYFSLAGLTCAGWSELSIACWCYPVTDLSYLFLIRGSSAHRVRISGDGLMFRDNNNSSQKIIAFGATIPQNTWSHLVCIYKRGEVYIYINGVLTAHSTTYYHSNSVLLTDHNEVRIGRLQSSSGNYYYNGRINDFRIYDHALSAQEVKKLAQGLILHYPLNGFYNGCNPNLLKNGRFYQGLENWPISSNTISIETNGGQYGHDCLRMEITNGGIVTPRQSTQFSLKGNTIYTVTVIAKIISGDFSNYYIRVANTLSFSLISITNLNNDWKKYIYQYTPPADINLTNVIGFAGSGSIIVLISEIKLEEDSRSTPWMPHISEFSYQYNAVYDISGYKNHGTVVGSLTAAAGSPRYKSCVTNNDTSYITCPQLFGEVQTISFWLKSDKSNGCFIIEPNSKLGFCISNNLLLISRWVQLTYDATSFISNEWNHIVLVKTGESTVLLYINGVEITERGSNNNNIAHTASVPWLFWRSYNKNYHGVGSMSDLRIYSTILNADDITELYKLGQA